MPPGESWSRSQPAGGSASGADDIPVAGEEPVRFLSSLSLLFMGFFPSWWAEWPSGLPYSAVMVAVDPTPEQQVPTLAKNGNDIPAIAWQSTG